MRAVVAAAANDHGEERRPPPHQERRHGEAGEAGIDLEVVAARDGAGERDGGEHRDREQVERRR